MSNRNEDMLDDLLSQARKATPEPDGALMARVLEDASRVQAAEMPAKTATTGNAAPGLLARLIEVIGGWPAASGVAAAGVAGLWLGLAPTAGLETISADLMGTTTSVSFFGDLDLIEGWADVDGS